MRKTAILLMAGACMLMLPAALSAQTYRASQLPDGQLHIEGATEAEQRYAREHVFLCRAPQEVAPYSDEWVACNRERFRQFCQDIDQSALSAQFGQWYKQYSRYYYLYQLLNGARTATTFKPAGKEVELAADYYGFLRSLHLTDSVMMLPKWFELAYMAMEEMERNGLIAVSHDRYIAHYLDRMEGRRLRSAFAGRLVEQLFEKGYYEDVAQQLDDITPLLPADSIAAIRRRIDSCREQERQVAKGCPMPDFEVTTPEGQTRRISDFRGKVLLLDFWYTGCIPCKAEMPHTERLARELSERDIQVISISLDTGPQLMAAWQKMMAERDSTSPLLSVNLPGGFRSQVVKQLGIQAVPRLMVIDADGKIRDAHAKRPSDPKLRSLLME